MGQRYRKDKLVAWRPGLATHLGEDREAGREVLLAFLADTSRDAFMRFRNRLRRWQRAEHPAVEPVLDSGELAGGVLFYALDAAGTLPLDFVLAQGHGDAAERAAWAEALRGALAALHEARLPHGRLDAAACRIHPDGSLRLGDPDLLGEGEDPTVDAPALEALEQALVASPGPPLAPAYEELRAAHRAAPSPKPARPRPTHRRPRGPTGEQASGPGPYRIPPGARLAAALALGGLAALAWWAVAGG